MPLSDFIVIASSVLGTALFIVAVVNALVFHFRYQKELDQSVMKEQYYDGGILMGLNRLMMYGHYCLFPKRAKRDGVDSIFGRLDRRQKFHLKLHWLAIIGTVLIYLGGYIYARTTGMLD